MKKRRKKEPSYQSAKNEKRRIANQKLTKRRFGYRRMIIWGSVGSSMYVENWGYQWVSGSADVDIEHCSGLVNVDIVHYSGSVNVDIGQRSYLTVKR
ncbi:hypothetical protein A7K91_00340 [Paenibacillus oryzae]|uniref:Uncharacterized protein n=2 Tax=Paenibacillus oryzae TaxID=1844972 RepID=A0A1A5YUC2_9BACL|nr:hypothetical protein A7K91_00340 [Paenibacillus oryzae]